MIMNKINFRLGQGQRNRSFVLGYDTISGYVESLSLNLKFIYYEVDWILASGKVIKDLF